MDIQEKLKTQRVALVDDHHIVRKGLVASVNNMDGYEVIMEASNGQEFLKLLQEKEHPDIVIMDLHMPIMDGFDTISKLKLDFPNIKTLALTVDTTQNAPVIAIKNGARGFVRKNERPAFFKTALDCIALSGWFFNNETQGIYQSNPHLYTSDEIKKQEIVDDITKREMEFLKLVCDHNEYTYEQIADLMSIQKATVDYYRKELFEKFHLKSKAGLVLFVVKWKLFEI